MKEFLFGNNWVGIVGWHVAVAIAVISGWYLGHNYTPPRKK